VNDEVFAIVDEAAKLRASVSRRWTVFDWITELTTASMVLGETLPPLPELRDSVRSLAAMALIVLEDT
jgi:hypothetical protein